MSRSMRIPKRGARGAAGSARCFTLFRKFLLVVLLVTVGLIVLSAMGIDITPLLAGAGILGLAIGTGIAESH